MSRAAAPALALAVMLLGLAAASAQPPGVEQTPQLFIVRSRQSFDDVMMSLEEAIKRRNWMVTGINHMDDTLRRRAADLGDPAPDFERYKIVGLCNLTLADHAIRANPYVGVFLPCRALIYRARGTSETVVVTFRPSFLAPALGGVERMGPVMAQAEADLLAILAEVAAD